MAHAAQRQFARLAGPFQGSSPSRRSGSCCDPWKALEPTPAGLAVDRRIRRVFGRFGPPPQSFDQAVEDIATSLHVAGAEVSDDCRRDHEPPIGQDQRGQGACSRSARPTTRGVDNRKAVAQAGPQRWRHPVEEGPGRCRQIRRSVRRRYGDDPPRAIFQSLRESRCINTGRNDVRCLVDISRDAFRRRDLSLCQVLGIGDWRGRSRFAAEREPTPCVSVRLSKRSLRGVLSLSLT